MPSTAPWQEETTHRGCRKCGRMVLAYVSNILPICQKCLIKTLEVK